MTAAAVPVGYQRSLALPGPVGELRHASHHPDPIPLVDYAANGGETWTSIYTVDIGSLDLQETYLPAIGDNWTTQDLTSKYGTPPG